MNSKEKSNFDEMLDAIKSISSWEELVPDYDEASLMVHWSNITIVPGG